MAIDNGWDTLSDPGYEKTSPPRPGTHRPPGGGHLWGLRFTRTYLVFVFGGCTEALLRGIIAECT